jgi:hypothetical protein
VWIVAGVCVALIVLVVKVGTAPGEHDQAFVYVVVGGVLGLLLHLLRRLRRKDHR